MRTFIDYKTNINVSIILTVHTPTEQMERKFEQFNRPNLETIAKYTSFHDKELIVIDNGSDSRIFEFFSSAANLYKIPIRILSTPIAIGLTLAANQGFSISLGNFVILLNDDLMLLHAPVDHWINLMLNIMNRDPKVGVTGPINSHENLTNIDFCVGACSMWRKAMLDQIGIFDPVYSPGWGEEIDLTNRAMAFGWKYVHCTDPVNGGFPLYHAGGVTMHQNPDWQRNADAHAQILYDRKQSNYWERLAGKAV